MPFSVISLSLRTSSHSLFPLSACCCGHSTVQFASPPSKANQNQSPPRKPQPPPPPPHTNHSHPSPGEAAQEVLEGTRRFREAQKAFEVLKQEFGELQVREEVQEVEEGNPVVQEGDGERDREEEEEMADSDMM